MDNQITLRDYLRVAWSGRWLVLAATVAALVIGALLTVTRSPSFVATSRIYLGQATTVSGVPVSTPYTNPSVAPLALANDDLTKTVAEKTGFSRSRVRKAVELTTPRISGANVPTILTVTATDRGQKASVTIANEYAQAVLAAASAAYDDTRTVYEDNARRADQEVRELRAQLTRFRTQLAASSPAQFPAIEASISNAMAQLDAARREASDQAVLLSKAEQIEAPQLLTQAEDGVSAHPRTRRLMTVILAGLIGFAVGLLATFVWRGSPATRAAHGEG
ncbi:MAG: Wzz/FepE/Etk N-terminal domain-containing protein [Thermoleophilia bacterium]